MKTSALIDPAKFSGTTKIKVEPLPSIALIEKEIAIQGGAKRKAQLAETNLLIQGDGTQVVVASKETMLALNSATKPAADTPVLLTLDGQTKSAAITRQSRARTVVVNQTGNSSSSQEAQ